MDYRHESQSLFTKWRRLTGIATLRMRNILVGGVFFIAIIQAAHPQNSARLNLRWDNGTLSVTGVAVFPGEAKLPRGGVFTKAALRITDSDGLVAQIPLDIPDRLYFDELDPETNTLSGGSFQRNAVDFSIRVPWPGGDTVLEWTGGGSKQTSLEWRGKELRAAKADGDIEKLLDNGPDSSNLVFLVLGDGYTAAELGSFRADAAAIMAEYLSEPPFDTYSSYVNVYALDTASNESGADHPSDAIFVDTAFGASFSEPTVPQLLTVDEGAVLTAAIAVPTYDEIFVIVNESQYGGSGGIMSVLSTHALATDLALHEMGHTFAELADEYEAACPPCDPFAGEPNVTDTFELEDIPWRAWIEDFTPIPTPDEASYDSEVGLFEGARYQSVGLYRPKRNCKMRSLSQPFCEVCQETHVLSLYRTAGVSPVETFAPNVPAVDYAQGSLAFFDVVPKTPVGHEVGVQWYLDGNLLDEDGAETVILDTNTLGGTAHALEAVVTDTTPLVRNDPDGLLTESVSWTLKPVAGPRGFSLSVYVGETFTLSIPGDVNEAVPVQWKKDSAVVFDGGTLTGANARALMVDPADIPDSGSYYARYEGSSGTQLTYGPILVTVYVEGSLPATGSWALAFLFLVTAAAAILPLRNVSERETRTRYSRLG
jgi:hypothetical protein